MVLGSWTADCVAAAIFFFGLIYYYLTATYDFWEKLNVPYAKPSFPCGNFGRSFAGKVTFTQNLADFYPTFKERGFGGVFSFREPVLLVCEPELIKQFLTKDFSTFHDRGIPYDEESDPFSANLFNLSGQRWTTLRAKLSPTFTTGKIRGMVPLIQECTEELKKCLKAEIKKKNGSVEMKNLLNRYTTDVIGTCAFGINCNSLSDPNTEFHNMSREAFRSSFANILRFVITEMFPKMAKYLKFKNIIGKSSEFFSTLMTRTVKYRKENKIQRNDFVQLMMKIMDEEPHGMSFNQNVMAAQAFLFFIAGLDNIYNTIGFSLHALALDPDLQERVFEEVSSVLEEFEGKICPEAIGKMDLLSRVIDEALRIYTPSGVLLRKQTEDSYIIPGTDIELKKGVSVMIPVQALHNDEEYFPNPKKFDPDRFTEEEKAKRHPFAYLPFGEGPRFCIAKRFAQLEMRLCFAELVRTFRFSIVPETDLSLSYDVRAFGPTPKNGFWLGVTERI